MAEIDDFITAPSQELLHSFTKEQLLIIAEHFSVVIVGDKRFKENIKAAIKSKLVEEGLMPGDKEESLSPTALQFLAPGLTFEQQKEILILQMEHEKIKQEHEKMTQELEMKKQLELARIHQESERAKVDLERQRLTLVRDGRLSGEDQDRQGASSSAHRFDVNNLRLLPQFNERDPDTFFLMFERVATARNWPDVDRALMLQCVLSGKAQEAYSSLSLEDSSSYSKIKSAVLKAYELVPEAYRQRFRSWEKKNGQTYVEFVRDLSTHFKRWLSALDVSTFDNLCDLMILEQLKNCLPERIAKYITEQKVTTAAAAAVSADEYALLHRNNFRERSAGRDVFGGRGNYSDNVSAEMQRSKKVLLKSDFKTYGNADSGNLCNYCHEKGHWKADCPVLKAKTRGMRAKPAAFAAPVQSCSVSEVGTVFAGLRPRHQTY
ncbi:uncharacterized protein LOC117532417 [Xyrichtys novacula]|uniref:Uncharacterized protein LOC117532417 n=1 Tax=Xyrichtys novacula TaxID=13765 RepID=A0AAV1HMD4_XYRNO|nr:uncharacterized protein LOC117532417 [Xyrichtys novacula]